MTSDEKAMLSAIIADPANDTPRLIYADWLEEQGDADRAEFIRVQCRIAEMMRIYDPISPSHAEWKELRQRERELWDLNKIPLHLSVGNVPIGLALNDVPREQRIMPILGILRRGFVAEVHCTLADWMGGECGECNGTGRRAYPNYQNGNPDWTCKKCYGGGVIPGYGPAIVAAQPVEVVRVTDMPIYPSSGNNTYYVGGLGRLPQKYWRQLEGLPSRQAAVAALSAALIAWAKEQKEQA